MQNKMSHNKLKWCNHCKENSMVRKIYTDKLGNRSVIEYCINKGCGSRTKVPIFK